MTFNDIFKSSFLNNVTAVSVTDMMLTLLLSFVSDFSSFTFTKRHTPA